LFAHGARAAPPQILGLVATATPTPLTCENGKCWAEFSAFCLQQHRKSPDEKTVYVPAADTKLTLQVTAADGSVRTVDAASLVTIESERVFLSVRIGLPESVIREMNGAHAAISVGKLASLVPAVTGGAGNPMTAAEIAHFTGPMRARRNITSSPAAPATGNGWWSPQPRSSCSTPSAMRRLARTWMPRCCGAKQWARRRVAS
jgi:hypothetical protein